MSSGRLLDCRFVDFPKLRLVLDRRVVEDTPGSRSLGDHALQREGGQQSTCFRIPGGSMFQYAVFSSFWSHEQNNTPLIYLNRCFSPLQVSFHHVLATGRGIHRICD